MTLSLSWIGKFGIFKFKIILEGGLDVTLTDLVTHTQRQIHSDTLTPSHSHNHSRHYSVTHLVTTHSQCHSLTGLLSAQSVAHGTMTMFTIVIYLHYKLLLLVLSITIALLGVLVVLTSSTSKSKS